MRIVFLLLLAMLAVKTATTTSAQGQEACSRSYVSCLDKCAVRPSKMLQDNCGAACQTQSTSCFSKQFGVPGPATQTVRQEPAPKAAPAASTNEADAADEQRPALQSASPAKPAPVKTAKPEMKPAERQSR